MYRRETSRYTGAAASRSECVYGGYVCTQAVLIRGGAYRSRDDAHLGGRSVQEADGGEGRDKADEGDANVLAAMAVPNARTPEGSARARGYSTGP